MYGFRRLAKGEDQGCYFHPKFRKNRRDLLQEIKRLPTKGSLETYEEVINSMSQLPSELYGSSRSNKRRSPQPVEHSPETSGLKRKMVTRLSTQQLASNNFTSVAGEDHAMTSTSFEKVSSRQASDVQLPSYVQQQGPQGAYSGGYRPAQQGSSYSSAAPVSQFRNFSNAPKTMSKLTMNIGYGKMMTSNPPLTNAPPRFVPNFNANLNAHSSSMYGQTTVEGMQRGSLDPYAAIASAASSHYGSDTTSVPYNLPISSNFAQEGRAQQCYSYPQNFSVQYVTSTNVSSSGSNQQSFASQGVGYTYPSANYSSAGGNNNTDISGYMDSGGGQSDVAGEDLIGSLISRGALDDLDVLDLFAGDIPQSIHSTPIHESPSASLLFNDLNSQHLLSQEAVVSVLDPATSADTTEKSQSSQTVPTEKELNTVKNNSSDEVSSERLPVTSLSETVESVGNKLEESFTSKSVECSG